MQKPTANHWEKGGERLRDMEGIGTPQENHSRLIWTLRGPAFGWGPLGSPLREDQPKSIHGPTEAQLRDPQQLGQAEAVPKSVECLWVLVP